MRGAEIGWNRDLNLVHKSETEIRARQKAKPCAMHRCCDQRIGFRIRREENVHLDIIKIIEAVKDPA